jgi:excinuclease UvrABC nuclease subunit
VTVAEKLKALPVSAGIYLHKNAAARSSMSASQESQKRVRQYFQSSRNQDYKTRQPSS